MPLFTKAETPYRIGVASTGVALFVVCSLYTFIGRDEWRRYQAHLERNAIHEKQLAASEAIYRQHDAYLKKVSIDSEFLEHITRERLGYTREGEIVLRFE